MSLIALLLMALSFECGSFTWPNTTASQTINLVNSSLTPKAVIMWTKGAGAAGFTATSRFSIGFGTRRGGSTQSGCVGIINIDNVATSDTARVRNTTLLHVLSSTSATDYTITLDSFGAGTIGVTASSGTNANGDIIHYMVWGGADITDANVVDWTMDATAGAEAITGVGFQPTAVFCLDSNLVSANAITAGLSLGFGAASSSTQFASMISGADDADTMTSGMVWGHGIINTRCIARNQPGTGNEDAGWDLDSFDSDGASLGVVNAPTATNNVDTFLFIKGGVWEAGTLAKDTDTGTDDFTLVNTSLTPKGVVLFGANLVNSTWTNTNTDFCVGSTDGTREIAAGITGAEAINTATDSFINNDRAIEELTGNTPTETSEADFSAFSAGAFQLNWAVNGGVANTLGYMAFGDEPVTLTAEEQMAAINPAAIESSQWHGNQRI